MALGFGVGSILFALGAVFSATALSPLVVNLIYASGAVCFTSAAAVQWRQAVDHHPGRPLRDPDWLSAAVQFVGTVEFNIMTVAAVLMAMDSSEVTYQSVWRPDVIGSSLFLASSWIAWHPIARERRHDIMRGRSRLICWANMLGSLFFGVSAVGAQLLSDGQFRDPYWNAMGTFLGAIGFFVAAVAVRPTAAERATYLSH